MLIAPKKMKLCVEELTTPTKQKLMSLVSCIYFINCLFSRLFKYWS